MSVPLFGACVRRGPSATRRILDSPTVEILQSRNPEIENPGATVVIPQDVARLQVAVDDPVAMGELHGLANLLKQQKLLQRAELLLLGKGVQRPGTGMGDGLAMMERLSRDLPRNMAGEWTEVSYLQKEASKLEQFRDLLENPLSAFALGVVLVFFVLAGLYESWSLPWAVILVVPMCRLSAPAGLFLAGMDVNVFVQVGFVVLVGLAAKNAILFVEFARDRKVQSASRFDASVEAARMRLRPIVMTSFAFILGVFPLVNAHGAGAEMRQALVTAVYAGMIGVTLFGIFLTPVFYNIVNGLIQMLQRSGDLVQLQVAAQ